MMVSRFVTGQASVAEVSLRASMAILGVIRTVFASSSFTASTNSTSMSMALKTTPIIVLIGATLIPRMRLRS